jgi:YHS domain-containing protein/mono/diheme cytochrome c family protein
LRQLATPLVWLLAGSALFAIATGFTLSREPGYEDPTVTNHMWLGIAIAVLACVMAVVHSRTRRNAPYRVLLASIALLLLPAGHLGSTLTHGEGFLTEPLRAKAVETGVPAQVESTESPVAAPAKPADTYTTTIAPIFAAKCIACHGERKHKGGLALHTLEKIQQGGEDGPVIVSGQPAKSELVRRLHLALDDEDHMPPSGKPQPSAAEIAAIEQWITAGAGFGSASETPAAAPADAHSEPVKSAANALAPTVDPVVDVIAADSSALEAMRSELVHVQPVAQGSNLLWIDFAAPGTRADDAMVERLLAPVTEQVAELTLARTSISDAALTVVAKMPRLRRLDLRATKVTDAGLARIKGNAALVELVLVRTKLTDASVDTLLSLAHLERVFVWNSGLSTDAIARLRTERSSLAVDAGDTPDVAGNDAEQELKLTNDLPSPDAPKTAAAPASTAPPTPINAVCPVSGSPVDARYVIVHQGKVIGFCCPKCPSSFWAEPEKYLSKLP